MKKIFEVIGLFSLIIFSFFYTSKISMVIKENDDILIQIKEIKDQYKNEPMDALISGNTIIPGLMGSEIDINKSYRKMKKIDSFNTNLLIYKDIKPNISINGVYDKYIISGNQKNKKVSILFLLRDNDDINKIISILNNREVNATFFTDGKWFENNNELIIELINDGHTIGNLGYNDNYDNKNISWMNAIVKKIGKQKDTYCYNVGDDVSLKLCNDYMSYTIKPNIIVKENPLIEIKQHLKNGSIISLEVNNTVIKELPLILDYINFKDLEAVNIQSLLEE